MYEIQVAMFPLLFFRFHRIKSKSFAAINDKYSFEFLALSYLRNQDIMSFRELKQIFPQLISEDHDFVVDEENNKVMGVFSYYYNKKSVRFLIIIQAINKNINFRCKMKKKTEIDFYEPIQDKKALITDLKTNIIEEVFGSFIVV